MGFVYNLEFFRIDSGDISLILDERLKEYWMKEYETNNLSWTQGFLTASKNLRKSM